VDPNFRLNTDVLGSKQAVLLFSQTSDDFFATNDVHAILGGAIDLAFLDGLHLFEVLLRDFINTEKYCKRCSVVALHDCIPPDRHVARRDEADRTLGSQSDHPNWWAGDVWKVAAILLQYRPDLDITFVDAMPTGLVFVTNLDPTSPVLESRYFEICRTWMDVDSRPTLEEFLSTVALTSTDLLETSKSIGRYHLP
jgi:hypothetical protein